MTGWNFILPARGRRVRDSQHPDTDEIRLEGRRAAGKTPRFGVRRQIDLEEESNSCGGIRGSGANMFVNADDKFLFF